MHKPVLFLPPPVPVDASARRFAVAVVLILTAARVAALIAARTDLYVDEAQYWSWAQALDWGYFSKPPLIAVLIAATTGLFGDGEWAVRLSAPLLHGATALILARLGDRLYGGRVGPLAGILYATLPAVSLSSLLISTDVPLLFAWSLGLLFAERLVRRDDWPAALGLGCAIALGVNAKYPMVFLPGLLVLACLVLAPLRRLLLSPRLWVAIGIGALGFVPNLVWNLRHDFATFRHTGYNANWGGRVLDLSSLGEFVGGQFGVFGPVLFLVLLLVVAGRLRSDRPGTDRLLLLLSAPVIGVFVVQSLLSDANANWAATAYPAATVLVAAVLAVPARRKILALSTALHGFVAVALLVGPAFAPELRLPGGKQPFERVLGWRDFAEAVGAAADETGARTLVAPRRADVAALLYYLRDRDFAVATPLAEGAPPEDHYQMTRPFRSDLPPPGLLVAPERSPWLADPRWRAVGPERRIPVGRGVTKDRAMALLPVAW